MTTEIKYQLLRVTGPDMGYQVGELCNSEMSAKNRALSIKDRESQEYKIISIVTTRSTLDVFTVPAYVSTLEEIARDIIDGSDGSFYIEWGDDIEQLRCQRLTGCDGISAVDLRLHSGRLPGSEV